MRGNEVMNRLIKPQKFNKGDEVATVSMTLGNAGKSDVLWRRNFGKNGLKKVYGLVVIFAPNSMKSNNF